MNVHVVDHAVRLSHLLNWPKEGFIKVSQVQQTVLLKQMRFILHDYNSLVAIRHRSYASYDIKGMGNSLRYSLRALLTACTS